MRNIYLILIILLSIGVGGQKYSFDFLTKYESKSIQIQTGLEVRMLSTILIQMTSIIIYDFLKIKADFMLTCMIIQK